MTADFSIDIEKAIQNLLQGPRYPDREFVRSGATFAEVYAMAASLRATLAGPEYQGQAVCLAAENKAIIAAALLASLAGGPSLLLPYAFSAKALAKMQQATGFTTAISDVKRDFPGGVQVICPQSTGATEIPVSGQSLPRAELLRIFTGGSTGAPQVWAKTKENIFSEASFLASRYEVTEEDCIMATIPAYHIYGLLFSVVLPLVSSATVVDETPSFPNEIAQLARDNEITILASVPAHYRVLAEVELNRSLRLAFSSAGMLDAADNGAFCRRNKIGVVEVYGSTETGGIATRNRERGEDYFTPFPTIDWKIVGGRLAVCSAYISPDLAVDEKDFFTASDRVEARGTNEFTLKGRADTVTKVGGKRVDLDEIRLLIKNESGVTDCVVMALPESGGREHRIGALIQGNMVDTETIRKRLVDSLEPYALPRRMKTVDLIPVKENGKYDWLGIARLLKK
ncbi:MAG: acyl-coenzyme A synthetase/AMP-(fatty) acid ligase [Desulforhopalus sp.]|jgi:acyl-coenzyme A synthetase/AMP-(fatty) acid ligase